jgi:hypothetical protein
MKFKTLFQKLLTDTAVYFAWITAIYALLMLVVHVGEDEILLPAANLLIYFAFSLLAALAQGLYRIKRIPTALRLLLHYLILTVGFYLCFLLPAAMRPIQTFIGIIAFSIVWALVMGIAALFVARFRKNAAAEQEPAYKRQFQAKR